MAGCGVLGGVHCKEDDCGLQRRPSIVGLLKVSLNFLVSVSSVVPLSRLKRIPTHFLSF